MRKQRPVPHLPPGLFERSPKQLVRVLAFLLAGVLLSIVVAGCTLFDWSPGRSSQPEPEDQPLGYIYRLASSSEEPHAVLYFPLAAEESIVVPVSRAVSAGENVQLVQAAIQELLAGPVPGTGLAPVEAGTRAVQLSGASVEDDQVYLVLSGARPSDRLLAHLYLTLAGQGYKLLQVFWDQNMIAELGSREQLPDVNVVSPGAGLRVYLPVAATTEESRRLYVVPATVNATPTPTGAVGYVFSATEKGTDTLSETVFDGVVPELFAGEAEPPVVRVSGATVVVDFSRDTIAAFEGGAAGEAALLDALTMTLTEFPTVETVEFRVDGGATEHLFSSQPVETTRRRPVQLNPE